jgi:hypothetical protein
MFELHPNIKMARRISRPKLAAVAEVDETAEQCTTPSHAKRKSQFGHFLQVPDHVDKLGRRSSSNPTQPLTRRIRSQSRLQPQPETVARIRKSVVERQVKNDPTPAVVITHDNMDDGFMFKTGAGSNGRLNRVVKAIHSAKIGRAVLWFDALVDLVTWKAKKGSEKKREAEVDEDGFTIMVRKKRRADLGSVVRKASRK